MKNKMIILLLISVLATTGCGKSEELKPNEENISNSPVSIENKDGMEESNLPIQELDDLSEFSFLIEDRKVTLMDWEDEVNLGDLFGKPKQEKIEQLGSGSDTFAGAYIKELKFSGVDLKLFSPKDNGKKFYILSMEVSDPKYQTIRGVKVGDALEALNKNYPEITPIPDGREDKNNRGYRLEQGAYNYITFEIKEGFIIKISIYHEFA